MRERYRPAVPCSTGPERTSDPDRSRAGSTGSSPNREESAVRSASSTSGSARGRATPAVAAAVLAALLVATARGVAAEPLPAAALGGGVEAVRALAAEGAAGGVPDRVRALERAGFRVEVAVAPHTFFVRAAERAALPSGFADVTPGAAAPVPRVASPRPSGAEETSLLGGGPAA